MSQGLGTRLKTMAVQTHHMQDATTATRLYDPEKDSLRISFWGAATIIFVFAFILGWFIGVLS